MRHTIALIVLSLCFPATGQQIITITTDKGGLLADRIHDDWDVRIIGDCESACTLYLRLPPEKLCVSPQAWLGFHRPRPITHNPGWEFAEQTWTEVMWAGWPAALQARLKPLTDKMQYLRGRDLIAIGYRECH